MSQKTNKSAFNGCKGLPADLSKRLAQHAAQSPSLVLDERLNLEAPLAPAAVLMPLLCHQGEWHVLLTRRTEKLWSHPGQVAFPGGAWESGDESLIQTALRESHEEISLQPECVNIIGTMPSFGTISFFELLPVVGTIPWPLKLSLKADEVAHAFIVPLSFLSAPGNHYYRDYLHNGKSHPVVYFKRYEGELIWGITAQILLEFLKIIEY